MFFIVALKGFVNYIIEGENIKAAYTSSPLPVFIGSLTPFFFFFVYSDKITWSDKI
jgi:hypothetical protein